MSERTSRYGRLRSITRLDAAIVTGLFALAFVARIAMVLASPGGVGGNVGDDGAAYYAGADAIVHGRLPYRDFVLLHPPLLDLFLTPFAALGSVTSDHAGFIAATVATELVGAASAVLVFAVALRLRMGRAGAGVAGLFYAVWFGAVAPDMMIRLETVGTFLTLLALLALTGVDRPRNAFLAGLALGAAATVKIWGVVPIVVVLVWWFAHRRTRPNARPLLAGVVVALVVVCGPFFLAAPSAMWRMIVTDQLGRNVMPTSRLQQLTGLADVLPGLHGARYGAVVTVVCALLVAAVVLALRMAAARMIVVLALAELVVLAASPTYFTWYLGFLAAPLAITVGAAAASLGPAAAPVRGLSERARRWVRRGGAAAVAAIVVFAGALTVDAVADVPPSIESVPFPRAMVGRAIAGAHCPMADGPMALIQTDTLSSTLADGCQNWVDVSGRIYDVDRAPQGGHYPRVKNVRWQRDLRSYLLSGDVVVLFRPRLGLSPALQRAIHRLPLLGRADGVSVYRVRR